MGKNATRITPPVVSIARETVEHCCQKKSEGALLDVPRYGELLGEAILQRTCKFSCYANGKFNLSLTSLPDKAHPPSEANLFRRETAGHKVKDHLWIKLGAEAKKVVLPSYGI